MFPVLKFGGTSVGSAQRIKDLVKLTVDSTPKIVVLSAMSGTTNALVEICSALYKKDADVYILDEPFSELDEASEERLLTHFSQLAREGKIVILITHNKKSLGRCDRLITLHDDEPITPNARNRSL